MVWTRSRFARRRVEASAVRKAVSSVAAMKASGVPLGRRRVSVPMGVVDWEEDSVDAVVEAAVDVVEAEEGAMEGVEGVGPSGEASVTTLTPVVVVVRAGMNSVFVPSLEAIDILEG